MQGSASVFERIIFCLEEYFIFHGLHLIITGFMVSHSLTNYLPLSLSLSLSLSLCVLTFESAFAGAPTVHLIQIGTDPEDGGSVAFSCSGISTTIPSDHSLEMSYDWSIDNIISPTGTRFMYGRNTLKISNVSRSDHNKVVTCKATELVSQGMPSEPSRQLLISVIRKF